MRDPSGRRPSEMNEMDENEARRGARTESEADELIDSIARELRRPVAVGGADFTARLMAEVERGPRPGFAPPKRKENAVVRVLEWAARPRTVRMSPLIGLAAAAGIAALAVLATPERVRFVDRGSDTAVVPFNIKVSDPRTPKAEDASDSVEFVLHAPDARSVAVAGDFNDWNATVTPLARRHDGLWVARVPLPAGRYEYTFVVDGATWMPDPAAPAAPGGDFGATNSVLVVGGPR